MSRRRTATEMLTITHRATGYDALRRAAILCNWTHLEKHLLMSDENKFYTIISVHGGKYGVILPGCKTPVSQEAAGLLGYRKRLTSR